MSDGAKYKVLCILQIRRYHWSIEEAEGVMLHLTSTADLSRELGNVMASKRYDSWRLVRYLPETLTPNF